MPASRLIGAPVASRAFGGHIERLIGTQIGKLHVLPGTTFSNAQELGDCDSKRHSALITRPSNTLVERASTASIAADSSASGSGSSASTGSSESNSGAALPSPFQAVSRRCRNPAAASQLPQAVATKRPIRHTCKNLPAGAERSMRASSGDARRSKAC
jgi:hypothetical protein